MIPRAHEVCRIRGGVLEVRTTEQRTRDVLALFDNEIDAWVASASADGDAHLIPLSYHWTGSEFLVAVPENSVTARNLLRAGKVRIAIGPTRDVAIVEGDVVVTSPPDDDPLWEIHASGSGFDARDTDVQYALLIITPKKVQTWRNSDELEGRHVMRNGEWIERSG
jgi:hypothetical protein